MFNLIVNGDRWADNRDTFPLGRIVEHTESGSGIRFKPIGRVDFEALRKLPTLFMEETNDDGNQVARVGTIIHVVESGKDVVLEYSFDPYISPIPNKKLEAISSDLEIEDFEFTWTHWVIKKQDLFRTLLRHFQPRRLQPEVFSLNEPEQIEEDLVSVMMPFSSSFDAVYEALKNVSGKFDFKCKRADDIWKKPAIIQDVVSLIDTSRVVICDCTGKNVNVFYEAGIAHTLGREVILITQSKADIPFDLRHLRYVHYLDNNEGLQKLQEKLEQKLSDIVDN